MNASKSLLVAAVMAASAFAGTSANALPVFLGYSTDGGTTRTQIATGNGGASISGFTIGNYTIDFSATGSPTLPQPDFGSNTLSVSSAGAGTLILYASEIRLTTQVTSITNGFSSNPLSNVNFTGSTYKQTCEPMCNATDAFTTTNLIATATVTPGTNQVITAPFPSSILPGDRYSNTEVYSITFGANGGRLNATIQEAGNIPEPMSLALLGTGLLGLGLARQVRRGKTAA